MNPLISLSSLSSDPLFSSIVALYILILFYSPHILLKILSSPVLISTAVLLLSLLRLGASQKSEENPSRSNHTPFNDEIGSQDQSQFQLDLVQWDLSAPLEVIYEAAYEGEEEEDELVERMSVLQSIERHQVLSKYYPETDSGSDDDDEDEGEWEIRAIGGWDSPGRECFRWTDHDEERDGGLIEIALDGGLRKAVDTEEFIEIDFPRPEIPTEAVFPGD